MKLVEAPTAKVITTTAVSITADSATYCVYYSLGTQNFTKGSTGFRCQS